MQMCVVRHHEHTIVRHCHAAVDSAGGIADEAFGSRALESPNLTSVAGIQRITFVRARHIHDAVNNNRRDSSRLVF